MVSISVKSRVRPDGSLDLNVRTGLPETDVEVLVVVQPIPQKEAVAGVDERGWPVGLFAQTFGCLGDDPLTREPEAGFEAREDLR